MAANFDEAKCKQAVGNICTQVENTVSNFKTACENVAQDFSSTGSSAGGVIGAAVSSAYDNYVSTPFGQMQNSLTQFQNRLDKVIADTVNAVSDVTGGLTSNQN